MNQSGWSIQKCSQLVFDCLSTSCKKTKRVSNYNKSEYINEMKLSDIPPPYDLKLLKKIQELHKHTVLFSLFDLKEDKTVKPVLINHRDPRG